MVNRNWVERAARKSAFSVGVREGQQACGVGSPAAAGAVAVSGAGAALAADPELGKLYAAGRVVGSRSSGPVAVDRLYEAAEDLIEREPDRVDFADVDLANRDEADYDQADQDEADVDEADEDEAEEA